jgi:hypothetical protein
MEGTWNRCEACSRKFKVQEWKLGDERKFCFTCYVSSKQVMASLAAFDKFSDSEKQIIQKYELSKSIELDKITKEHGRKRS